MAATGKMSGSTGLNLTPETLLHIYQPEVILWLYSRCEPTKAFDFCFDDGILRQYFEFDKQYAAYMEGTADEHTKEIMENCLIEGRTIKTVPMGHLVQLGSIVNFNEKMLETVFEKIGTPYIAGAKVTGTVEDQIKDTKVVVMKYKRRKNYKRTRGHRAQYTIVKVTDIIEG